MTFQQKYPEAYEDECGTVWVNKAAADAADWMYGDGFLENVLGWSMAEAIENWAGAQKIARRKAFWAAHYVLRRIVWFVWGWWGALGMFLRIVWRKWEDDMPRISWSAAWQMAGDLWLR